MKKSIFAVIAFLVPLLVSAHTKWFAEEEEITPFFTTEPTVLYLAIWAGIVVLVITTGIILHQRNILRFGFLQPKKSHAFERASSTFTMLVGVFLLIAGTHEYLFSPNQNLESGIPYTLIVFQIIIGLSFLLGIGTRITAIAMGLVWGITFWYLDWITVVENIWVLSTAVFIAIMGNDYFSIVSSSSLQNKLAKFKLYALSILRLGTGLALLILGFSEKILNPEFGINFLAHHNWNFIQTLGFNFSDYFFVLSAGVVESLFGLVFILGIMTRVNAFIVAVVFSMPLFILGPIELAGHIPHFAAVIMLLLFGSGGHFLFFKKYNDAKVSI